MDKLNEILDQLDIPEKRRDISKFENVSWLGRNLGANNKDKSELLKEVFPLLKELARKQLKKMDAY